MIVDNNHFLPENVLRRLGYNKRLSKTRPPETLYWHCLNTYYAAKKLANLLPQPLTDTEQRILLWSALLHDAEKTSPCWQEHGKGPHMLSKPTEEDLRNVLTDKTLTCEAGPISDSEIDLIIELIREHHTRKTLSNANVERILSVLKLADEIVSAQRITTHITQRVNNFLSPSWKSIVLTAEQHPASAYVLSLADEKAIRLGAELLLINSNQSLYLLPENIEVADFKRELMTTIRMGLANLPLRGPYLKKISEWIQEGPIRDIKPFLIAIHTQPETVLDEIEKDIETIEKRFERERKKGNTPDERKLWFGPFRILHHATQLCVSDPQYLLGTDIDFGSPGIRKDSKKKDEAMRVAQELGCKTPRDFAHRVVELIRSQIPCPQEHEIDLDILSWGDEPVEATQRARAAYDNYLATQWNSKTKRRNLYDFCFSCRRRRATREAPTDPKNPTDTWTSAAVRKSKVRVCDLCFLTHAYILNLTESARFHIDATPAYNQARIDWDKIFWEGLETPEFRPRFVTGHAVVLPLRSANTPTEALSSALGLKLMYTFNGSRIYRSYLDMLYLHGLQGVIGAGPQHPTRYLLSGNGIRITHQDWESYGELMKILYETNPQEVFPARAVWKKLTDNSWGWGTLLAIRHRRGTIKKDNVEAIKKVVKNMVETKEVKSERTILDKARSLPLHVADRDERFKAAESILRRMEQAVKRVSKDSSLYENREMEMIEIVAELGKKQLRSQIQKNSAAKTWHVSNERLAEVDDVFRSLSAELWRLKDHHTARQDFINAVIMAIAYSPVNKEDE